MLYLIGVSLLWAFSFGLIKGQLTGLDATAVAVVRLGCAAVVFLPFFRPSSITRTQGATFAIVGAIQFGLMYVLYLAAFRYLQAYEVAMFTILTPIYVILLDGALEGQIQRHAVIAAGLAVIGAGILQWRSGISPNGIIGFGLMQGSNLCFAAGQIAYKRLRTRVPKVSDASLFGWLYGGALVATGLISLLMTEWSNFHPTTIQWHTMIVLGLVASGLGFFGWHVGATKISASALAVFNNLKIAYKRLRIRVPKVSDASLFGWLYGGGLVATAVASVFMTEWADFHPTTTQWRTMIFLGLIASGLGFFGWNVGATKVSASTLAVFNNLKIPLAVTVALLVFKETADLPRLLICGAFMVAAIYVAEHPRRT